MRLRRDRDHVTVRAVHPTTERGAPAAHNRRRPAVVRCNRDVHAVDRHHRLRRRHIDDLPLARSLAGDQRRPDRQRERQPRIGLVDARAGHNRRAAVCPQIAPHARRRPRCVRPRQRARRPLRRRSVQPPRRERGDDQARMLPPQPLGCRAGFIEAGRRPVGDQHIGLAQQRLEQPLARVGQQIQRRAALCGVVVQEDG